MQDLVLLDSFEMLPSEFYAKYKDILSLKEVLFIMSHSKLKNCHNLAWFEKSMNELTSPSEADNKP